MRLVTVLKTGGEYNERHVEWLQRQVRQPVTCLTDSKEPMEYVTSIPLKHNFAGWWAKMEMFRDDLFLGDFLYVDLDTVFIKRGIPEEFEAMTETHVLSDMYGGDHINSGLMFLTEADRFPIWREFIREPHTVINSFSGGDQFYLDRHLRDAKRFQVEFPDAVVSYKIDVLHQLGHYQKKGNGDFGKASIVCFHGQPRPWQIKESWVPCLDK